MHDILLMCVNYKIVGNSFFVSSLTPPVGSSALRPEYLGGGGRRGLGPLILEELPYRRVPCALPMGRYHGEWRLRVPPPTF